MTKLSDLNILDIGNTIQLEGAIFVGNGKMYLCMFPGHNGIVVHDEAGDEVVFVAFEDGAPFPTVETVCMNTDEWNTFFRQTDLLETEVLAKSSDGKLAKVVLRKSQRNIAQEVSWKVYKRDDYKCRYCGRDDVPLTVDHLVLWEEGGPSTEANLVSACKKCNKARGNMQYDAWLQSPFYNRASKGLTVTTRQDNLDLASTLAAIPRQMHVPSKRK
jgi:hypothetical protein